MTQRPVHLSPLKDMSANTTSIYDKLNALTKKAIHFLPDGSPEELLLKDIKVRVVDLIIMLDARVKEHPMYGIRK